MPKRLALGVWSNPFFSFSAILGQSTATSTDNLEVSVAPSMGSLTPKGARSILLGSASHSCTDMFSVMVWVVFDGLS